MNERLIWEACLKDLGVNMSYDDFLQWLKGQTLTETGDKHENR